MKKFVALILFSFYLVYPNLGQSSDSLLNALNEDVSEKNRIELLHQLLLDIWLNYPEQAMDYGEQALEISIQQNDSFNISTSLRLIAGVHYYKGDYDESLDFNLRALEIALLIPDSSLINNGYNNIGLLYYDLGSYQTALEYLLKGLDMKKRINQIYGYSTTLNNIGLVFEKVGDYEEARKNFNEALEMSIQTNSIDQEIYSQNNIGITYLKQKEYDRAFEYFEKSLKLAEKSKNLNWGAVSLRGMGEIFIYKSEYDSADAYLRKALKDCKFIEDKKGLAEVYYLLARLNFIQENVKAATTYLDRSQVYARQIRISQQLLTNFRLYIELYENSSDLDNVIFYQDQFINLRDSLFQDVFARNLSLVPLKLKREEDRIRFADQQAELKSQELMNVLFIIIIVAIVPLVVFLIILLRKNNAKNHELNTNNEELKETQSLLVRSEKMASLGILAAGVGHEINNPLNFIKNGVSVLEMKLKEKLQESDEEFNQYFKIINEGINRTSGIVKSLSHFSRVGVNMNEKCNVHDVIENCLIILNVKLKGRVNIERNFTSKSVEILGNEGKLYQVFMNILSNAEQAIEDKGLIKIQTRKIKNTITVTIIDDGSGIEEENLLKINDPFYTTKDPGKGTGLGLFITHSIVEEHGGNVEVTSDINKGTKFVVTLPIFRHK